MPIAIPLSYISQIDLFELKAIYLHICYLSVCFCAFLKDMEESTDTKVWQNCFGVLNFSFSFFLLFYLLFFAFVSFYHVVIMHILL